MKVRAKGLDARSYTWTARVGLATNGILMATTRHWPMAGTGLP